MPKPPVPSTETTTEQMPLDPAPIHVDYMEQAQGALQAEAARAEAAKKAADESVSRTPRTPSTDAVSIDLEGPATVGRFIAEQAATNTLAARAYVRDYRAGRSQVGATAVPAYLGVGRLQRHDRMRHHGSPAHHAPRACR